MAASPVKPPLRSVAKSWSSGQEQTPQFDFCAFFHGHTRASGWFCDRFGNPRRHFCGDFYGYFKDAEFILDEKLFYTDGVSEERVWAVRVNGQGIFTAQSDSLVDGAYGSVVGDTLKMRYSMRVEIEKGRTWTLAMKDQMILQPDGSLHNTTKVFKWGVCIGIVSAQYLHHDGDNCCVTVSDASHPEPENERANVRRLPLKFSNSTFGRRLPFNNHPPIKSGP